MPTVTYEDFSGIDWDFDWTVLGGNFTLNYSFLSLDSGDPVFPDYFYSGGESSHYSEFAGPPTAPDFNMTSADDLDANLADVVRDLLDSTPSDNFRVSFSDVLQGVGFSEQSHTGTGDNQSGQISLFQAPRANTNDARTIYQDIGLSPNDHVGIALNSDAVSGVNGLAAQTAQGERGYWVMLHELGHALGLDHPAINAAYNSQKYTIMSYERNEDVSPIGSNFVYAHTLQILDIAALQALYGRAYNTRDESNVGLNAYKIGNGLGGNETPFMYTIWDGKGTDEIDASG